MNNNNSNELKTTVFKNPHWLEDEECDKRGIDKNLRELYKRYIYQQAFSVQKWYEELKEYTFPTKFVELDEEEIWALLKGNSHWINRTVTKKDEESEKKYTVEVLKKAKGILDNLGKRIDQEMEEWKDSGIFVKLNTRSPKDVCIYDIDNEENVSMMLNYTEEFLKMQDTYKDTLEHAFNGDQVLQCFVKSCTKSMRLFNGKSAIDLCLKSDRIFQDLSKVERFGLNNVQVFIVIRKFDETVIQNPGMEFRGFVYNNSLNALSQYDDATYYKEIADHKKEIGDSILSFFNDNIRDHLEHIESYVIDFYLYNNRIFVIELNPFHKGAGPCLFTWRDHRELFMNGPFEFRVVEERQANPLLKIHGVWERYLSRYVKKEYLSDKMIEKLGNSSPPSYSSSSNLNKLTLLFFILIIIISVIVGYIISVQE
eukprot:TRINITY_DN2564_c0_g1_i1.p2 TRINITY_DN2564_c0_g1~~TRINITY_DN2564_c0_g1_i1.p2  ORF type:complete len:426 (-),score=115.59 TRINITY_DN2564_c0_g1_i1:1045-2322(-)